jgi:ADP-ribose pyrophosphatase
MTNPSKKIVRKRAAKRSPAETSPKAESVAKTSTKKNTKAAGKHKKTVQVLSSKVVHKAAVFEAKVRRDIIHHPGSVVILAIDERKSKPSVLLIKQYRYAAKQELWELPAGSMDKGEDALAAAKRELAEETGYSASEWKLALCYYSSPGFLDETMSIFAARNLRKGKATPEEDEFITCKLVPLKKAVQWIISGKVHDGKAIAGVLWAAQKFHICGDGKVKKGK